jgi:hypothetical protein
VNCLNQIIIFRLSLAVGKHPIYGRMMPWFINENNGCYRYGSPYPAKKRLQVIVTYLETQYIAITSRICCVSYNCVSKYVRLFEQRATVSPLVSNNTRPKKMLWWMEAYLEALVIIYPTLYFRELKQLLADDFIWHRLMFLLSQP